MATVPPDEEEEDGCQAGLSPPGKGRPLPNPATLPALLQGRLGALPADVPPDVPVDWRLLHLGLGVAALHIIINSLEEPLWRTPLPCLRIGPHPSTRTSIMVLRWGGHGGFAVLHP